MISGPIAAVAAFIMYRLSKNIPFNYITQSDYNICNWLNFSFCARISAIITALLVYIAYLQINKTLALPVKNALLDPPDQWQNGAVIGAGIMLLSIAINIAFGFIELTGVNYEKLTYYPFIVFIGMLMTGFTEELMYRALPINALLPYFSEDLLVVLTALYFGYIHSGNSLYYGFSAFMFGLLTGYGFLKYGLYWASALHASSNTVETFFYSIFNYKVKNAAMAGGRETPDDDGSTTSLVQLVVLFALKYTGYL